MEKYIQDNMDAILEIATVIHARLGSDPSNAAKIFDVASDFVLKLGDNPFGRDARFFQRTSDERHTLLSSPQANGIIDLSIHKTKDVIEVDRQAEILAREHRRSTKQKTFTTSGTLPNGPHVKTLWWKGEGEMTNDDLLNPNFEGGMVYCILLESCHLNFAIENEVIENVPIPPTVFVVKTQKVLEQSEVGGTTVDNEVFRVVRTYAVCLDNGNFVTDESRIYDWPFGNVSVDVLGWMCLGNNFSSGVLKFPDATSISTLPHLIHSKFPTTGHYGAHMRDYKYKDLIGLLKSISGKNFPMEQLKHRGTYGSWIKSVDKDLYTR